VVTDLLARRLRLRDPVLPLEEREAIEDAVSHYLDVPPDVDMVSAHDLVDECKLIVEGWACRYGTLPDGRRQIMALHMGGDFVDLQSFPLKRMDHSVGTLTRCRVAVFPHAALTDITRRFPHLTRLLWLTTLLDATILRQWLLSVGRRWAVERLAHLLCELLVRLQVVGLSNGKTITLPLTQIELADALGVSPVHAHRVVSELRDRKLVLWRGQRIDILDRAGLEALAQFDATYLALESLPR
jgi:CRP-like cAMP-binding protein